MVDLPHPSPLWPLHLRTTPKARPTPGCLERETIRCRATERSVPWGRRSRRYGAAPLAPPQLALVSLTNAPRAVAFVVDDHVEHCHAAQPRRVLVGQDQPIPALVLTLFTV